jgi:hypothetical protein
MVKFRVIVLSDKYRLLPLSDILPRVWAAGKVGSVDTISKPIGTDKVAHI